MDRVAAVEIGGTKAQIAVGTSEGRIERARRGEVDRARGAEGIRAWIEAQLPALLKEAETSGPPARAIGLGFGGPVDSRRQRIIKSHHVVGWSDFPLRDWAEERFGLPAVLVNDSSAAGWGEWKAGAGRGTDVFFYMNVGTGIGGGIVIGGRLLDGQGFGAGEIGHSYVPVGASGAWNGRGKPPILEALCSGLSLEERVRKAADLKGDSPLARLAQGDPARIRGTLIAEAARAGDPVARAEIERTAGWLAYALSNVIALFHPQRIAIGGGVALMGDLLFEPLRKRVLEVAFAPFRDSVEIVPAALGEEMVLVGALLLAADRLRE
ncbi:MAG: ROK family protein [Candidatus Sumerlaeota bacterium]|nr:ROK family protein [Candidatus Sumerlaeota bacterium]